MDIEKQPGYKAFSKQRALKFEGVATALVAKTKPIIVFPTKRFPRMFAKDFSAPIEEAATTDGVHYEFRAPPASKRARALNAQRKAGEWWADIKHLTEVTKRLMSSAPRKFLTDKVTLARAQMEKAISEVSTHRKFAEGMMNAILRKANSANLHSQVLDPSKKVADGKTEEIALRMGRTLYDAALTMCALLYYWLLGPAPPTKPTHLDAPPGSREGKPDDPARSSASLQKFDKWAAVPAAASKRTSATPEAMDPRLITGIIQEFATPAEPPIHIALEVSQAAEETSTKIGTTMAGVAHTAPQVPHDTARAADPAERARKGARNEDILRGPGLPTQIAPRESLRPSEARRLPNDAELPRRRGQEAHKDDRVARKQTPLGREQPKWVATEKGVRLNRIQTKRTAKSSESAAPMRRSSQEAPKNLNQWNSPTTECAWTRIPGKSRNRPKFP